MARPKDYERSCAPVVTSQERDGIHTSLTCARCPAVATRVHHNHPSPQRVLRHFENLGWIIVRRRPLCPACQPKYAAKDKPVRWNDPKPADTARPAQPAPHPNGGPPSKPAELIDHGVVPPLVVGHGTPALLSPAQAARRIDPTDPKPSPFLNPVGYEPPASPTPAALASKRLIYMAIEEAYDEGRGSYKPGNSDDTVAKALEVPRQLVEKVRADFFGHAAGPVPPEVVDLRGRIDAILALAQERSVQAQSAVQEVQAVRQELNALVVKNGWRA